MKKLFNYFLMLTVALVGVVSLSSCGGDDGDEPVVTANKIEGKWKLQGSTDDSYAIMVFNKDGSGYRETETGTSNFKYTYSYDTASDTGTLKYWFLDSSTVYSRTIAITGTTMMMSWSTYTQIWNRI